MAQLEAQLHLQALNWDRYKVLVTKGVFSRQQGDQQEADFRVAEANVAAAQSTVQANKDNLERLLVLQRYEQVTAPFSGVITARNVDVGALISAAGFRSWRVVVTVARRHHAVRSAREQRRIVGEFVGLVRTRHGRFARRRNVWHGRR